MAGLALVGVATAQVTRAAAGAADGDLAVIRLLIASELLAIDFDTNALATKQYDGTATGPTFASEAQHLSLFSSLAGGSAIGPAPPGALPLDAATAALSDFES